MSKDWPIPAAPTHPGKIGLYYGRWIGGAVQNVHYCNWMSEWQAGVFLRRLLDEAELLEQWPDDNPPAGTQFTFLVVTEKDAQGEPMKSRTIWGRLVGVTFDEAMEASEKKADEELPYVENMTLNAVMGYGFTSRREVYRAPNTATPEPRRERKERAPSTPRPRGDNVTTLQELCADEKVEPKDVRGLLRKRGIEKPDGGWAWPKGDDRIGGIMDVIKAVKRGEKK